MTIRIRLSHVALLGIPVLLVLASLVLHDDYWAGGNPRGRSPGVLLLWLTGLLVAGWGASFSTRLRESLGRPHWHRFHYVRATPAKAAAELTVVRALCVVALWALGILAVLGRFAP